MADQKLEIKELERFLYRMLPPNTIINKYTTEELVGPGENYGSKLIDVAVEIQHLSSAPSTLHLVAKMCPEDEFARKIFNTPLTFKREIAMYEVILPTLRQFQLSRGICTTISCLPKCYGTRLSLDLASDTVDDDALILIENLRFSNFRVVNRREGFDLDAAKVVLKQLAIFHAIPIAIKTLKPDLFKSKILPHSSSLNLFNSVSDIIKQSFIDRIIETAELNVQCIPLVPKIVNALKYADCKNTEKTRDGPFFTINHNDFWVNNVMVKYIEDVPIECKLLDFQTMEYGSVGNDIVFFLYSSVKPEVVNLHFDQLLHSYYDALIATLESLKCSIEPFSYEMFLRDIEECAKSQFVHILFMLLPILNPKGKVFPAEEASEGSVVSEEYEKRVAHVILSYFNKKWL